MLAMMRMKSANKLPKDRPCKQQQNRHEANKHIFHEFTWDRVMMMPGRRLMEICFYGNVTQVCIQVLPGQA